MARVKFTITVFLSFLLISCGKSPPAQKKQQEIHLNFSRQPLTIDTRKTCDYVSSTLEFMLFEGLTRMSKTSTKEPALAKSIEISEDGLTYTFHLRNAFWSNGTQITSNDFLKSWQAILTPNFPSPSCNLLYVIEGAEEAKKGLIPVDRVGISAPDSKTLVVKLLRPTPYFLELTSFCVLFPTPPVANTDIDEMMKKSPDAIPFSGPFRLTKWKIGDEITLEKNPYYWDVKNVHLDSINISLIEHDWTAYQMFEKGDLDILGLAFSQIPKDILPSLKERGILQKHPIAATSLCQFNTNTFPFSSTHLRRAFSLAINREELINHISQANDQIAYGLVPPILKKGITSYFCEDHNKEKAQKELNLALEELGCSLNDLQGIEYLYTSSDNNQRLALVIQQQIFRALNIYVCPKQCEFKVFLDRLRKRNFSLSHSAWIVQYNDPMNILERFKEKTSPNNDPGWENSTYKNLLEESSFSTSSEERLFKLNQAEAILMSELPQVPLYHWNYTYMTNPHLKDVYISPIGSTHLTHAYYEEGE